MSFFPLGRGTADNQALEIKALNDLITAITALSAKIGPWSSGTATIITSPAITTSASVQIVPANSNRKGLIIWNQSANSIYISYVSPANSANNMTAIIPTFAQFVMPTPIYTGAIYAIRNAGTGFAMSTELT